MGEPTNILYPDVRRTYPTAVRAEGSYVYDEDGRAYLDGCSGAIAVNIGHRQPEILDAIRDQLERITFSYRTQFTNEPAERLAALLVELAPGDLTHVQYTNSGSEGTEAAVRIALQYWHEVDRPEKRIVLSRRRSYHGSTLGALALSGHPGRRRQLEPVLDALPLRPIVAEAHCHRCPFGLTRDHCDLDCATSLENSLKRLGPERVAAFVFEPVVGASGGAIPPPPGYLARIADICRRYDVLLIADEVMTGLGRTGHWFGCDLGELAPDLLVLGKGMSAGYLPIGAVLVSDRVHSAIALGSGACGLGHTYSANPLAAAAAGAVVDFLRRHDVPAQAAAKGRVLRRRLRELLAERGIAADVRGEGLLLGIDFEPPHGYPDSGLSAVRVADAAFARGLVLYPAGTTAVPRVVLVAPPLTASTEELDRLVQLLSAALDDVLAAARDLEASPL